MGCCRSKNKHAAASERSISKCSRSSSKEIGNAVIKFDEEDVCQATTSGERPSIITDGDNKSYVQSLVLDVLDVVRKLTERFVYE